MTMDETLASARFVVDPAGNRTDVLIPLAAWLELLESWSRMAQRIEDDEDAAIVAAWLQDRSAGAEDTVSLEAVEAELLADGLLPG